MMVQIYIHMDFNFFLIFFKVYLFLRERERQSVSRGWSGRDRNTESKAGSRL